jgi:hypothetical protein
MVIDVGGDLLAMLNDLKTEIKQLKEQVNLIAKN